MIELRRAGPGDAQRIAETRRIVWQETYRGIYPDEMLDSYDVSAYALRDASLLSDPERVYYLFLDGEVCAGFFSLGPSNYGPYKDFSLCLNHLYIRKEYRRIGLGKRAFSVLWKYCGEHHIRRFFCGCNAHNYNAREFYAHMGGILGDRPRLHHSKADEIVHFEFYQSNVELRKAVPEDAPMIARTRQKAWAAAYRGIYPDDAIDRFDLAWHIQQDEKRISREDMEVFAVMDSGECVGYYTFGDLQRNGGFWLMSLYLLPEYQHRGLGRMIFASVCAAGRSSGHRKLMLDCNPHNQNAMNFYTHMGGTITVQDQGHENPQEDSCYFEFTL